MSEQQVDDIRGYRSQPHETGINGKASELRRSLIGPLQPDRLGLKSGQHRQRHLGNGGGGDGPKRVNEAEAQIQVARRLETKKRGSQQGKPSSYGNREEQSAHRQHAESEQLLEFAVAKLQTRSSVRPDPQHKRTDGGNQDLLKNQAPKPRAQERRCNADAAAKQAADERTQRQGPKCKFSSLLGDERRAHGRARKNQAHPFKHADRTWLRGPLAD